MVVPPLSCLRDVGEGGTAPHFNGGRMRVRWRTMVLGCRGGETGGQGEVRMVIGWNGVRVSWRGDRGTG